MPIVPGRFDGAVVLVTGAAQGQGRNHALRFAREGADVVLVDLPPADGDERLASVAAEVESHGRRAVVAGVDIVDREALADAVGRAESDLGPVSVAVANAAITQRKPSLEITAEDWQRMLDVNLTGTWNTARAVLPGMQARGGGAIVMIGSIAGTKAMAELAHYSATKHAVAGLVKSLALEFGAHGIRVNAVLPTRVLTPMLESPGVLRRMRPDLPEPTLDDVRDLLSGTHALPVPWVESDDITAAVCWLASDEARYVTGVELAVDAGARLR
jgi:(+)-trans-carveol dehydrogenase